MLWIALFVLFTIVLTIPQGERRAICKRDLTNPHAAWRNQTGKNGWLPKSGRKAHRGR